MFPFVLQVGCVVKRLTAVLDGSDAVGVTFSRVVFSKATVAVALETPALARSSYAAARLVRASRLRLVGLLSNSPTGILVARRALRRTFAFGYRVGNRMNR